ncbi:hypothetical protein BKP45_06860 [Anaerobacillus alkalidiazotrophicus]|uniref:L,D-TPase catalytic domain-containing protein n=1 Tax=Anaerobacillus alkalidiazotrophicus TaxID=472963 RepID=A0A1S2MCL7_9BACI|nr:L,D-transpeptidase family protein [Anaerobacillus alkalidiazotrophicus]OIJ22350.1 hypothetical protein BKP45_06860 [Anaerobacillus alkalidiazotrophicus]
MLKKFLIFSIFVGFLLTLSFPITTSAATGQLIIINKSSNELAFYENNKLTRVFSVGTGKSPSLTPEGSFQIVNKIVNRPYYKENIPGGHPSNPLGTRWLGLNARGTWGTTYAIHGNNNPNSIGRYVSLGCVRMQNNEVEWLFDQVKVNTPVIIVTSTSSFDAIATSHDFSVTATTIGSAPPITNTLLQLGSTHPEVKQLQQSLTDLGYDTGGVGGHFDDVTEQAVIQFQKDHSILVDGIVGRQTKLTLRNSPGKPVSTTPIENDEPPTNTEPTDKNDNSEKPEPKDEDKEPTEKDSGKPKTEPSDQDSDSIGSAPVEVDVPIPPELNYEELKIKLIQMTLRRFGLYLWED